MIFQRRGRFQKTPALTTVFKANPLRQKMGRPLAAEKPYWQAYQRLPLKVPLPQRKESLVRTWNPHRFGGSTGAPLGRGRNWKM